MSESSTTGAVIVFVGPKNLNNLYSNSVVPISVPAVLKGTFRCV